MDDSQWMKKAILLAEKAEENGDVPVGAIIVSEGKIIASAYNTREAKGDACGHAEMNAIRKACRKLGRWRLSDCDLYVTMEPCPMCAGGILNARIRKVVYGVKDARGGAFGSLIDLRSYPFFYQPEVVNGVCEAECLNLLQKFFADKR